METYPRTNALNLGFHHKWFSLGIIDAASFGQIVARYSDSDDKNAEHYRWRAFCDYLNAAPPPLFADTVRALYHLGDHDPDFTMGGAILFELIGLPECPDDLLELALRDGERKALVKFAARVKKQRTGE